MNDSLRTIYDYLEAVLRRKWLLIIPFVIGTAATIAIAYMLPAQYKSTTLIMVEQQRVPEAYVTPTDMTPIVDRLDTIKQQVMSRTNLERIINEFNLFKDVEQGKMTFWLINPMTSGNSGAASMEEMIEATRRRIEVTIHGGSAGSGGRRGGEAFSISYSGFDPQVTMQVTNTLASLFIEENLKIREQYAEGTSEFLNTELEKAKLELEEQEKALKNYKERFMGKLPEQLDANLRTLDRLQMDLQTNQMAIKNTEDRKALLDQQIALTTGTQGNPSQSPVAVNPLEAELGRLKSELRDLLSVYKENYPDVIITKSRIAEIEKQLADSNIKKESQTVEAASSVSENARAMELAQLKVQITNLKKQESVIREQIKIYERRVEDTPASEQIMADLQRDYETSINNYQVLLEKKLSARLAENLEKRQKGERFRVIDPANLPEKPFKPNRRSVIAMGVMISLGVGLALVYATESLMPVFRKEEELTMALNIPVLASIPDFYQKKGQTKSNGNSKEVRRIGK